MMEYYDTKKMSDKEIKQAFLKCFSSKEGKVALSFLKRMTIDRYMGANCSNEELRYLEGQRYLVNYIISLCRF